MHIIFHLSANVIQRANFASKENEAAHSSRVGDSASASHFLNYYDNLTLLSR